MSSGKYRHIGNATVRKDAVDIVTGSLTYIDDIKMPGLLHGKILRSPHAHADIKSIDSRKATKLRAVRTVLTYMDVPDWKTGIPEPHQCVLDPLPPEPPGLPSWTLLPTCSRQSLALHLFDSNQR